ncbi:MAG: exonuclease SbcCD subunit D [Calditrichaeota bacterium]|nr:exonuclease SbcCD subunit D [Calditrichota bacterium]MBT7618891.1 exonuclease SbcCD subunit D [Calditrichota bacterium]MBT7787481.1 exonuclease SbcCD subunit D [Calditrichota bacterium]
MRFIHTADWHLGRILYGVHLTDDQAFLLDQFVGYARENKVDAVLIAGDIYDRAVPPLEAVRLLDETLAKLVIDLNIPVFMIPGNHDSGGRLGFGSRIMSDKGLHVINSLKPSEQIFQLQDSYGDVYLSAIPFIDPVLARQYFQDDGIINQNSALKASISGISNLIPPNARSIVLAHAFVTGGTVSDSERPISVGTAEEVEVSNFDRFNYVALGHLHRPQSISNKSINYSGSLLKYSFSEASHNKSFNFVEMDAKGSCTIEKVSLTAKHDLRRISGTMQEILGNAAADRHPDDYLEVSLTDTGPILNALPRLREVYKNVMHIERPQFKVDRTKRIEGDVTKLSDVDLFGAFYKQVKGVDLPETHSMVLSKVLNDMLAEQREAEDATS